MTDHDKLREAIAYARCAIREDREEDWLRLLANAAESTLPKTKMVEVWRVESAFGSRPCTTTHLDLNAAESSAADLRRDAAFSCIRVTGPHMQEVPDGR